MTDRQRLQELVKAGDQFRKTPIVDDDFPAYRNKFDEVLNTATMHLLKPVADTDTVRRLMDAEAERDALKKRLRTACPHCSGPMSHAAIVELKAEVALHRQKANGEYWAWQGDAEDHLESLTCPVLIPAVELRFIIAVRDQWQKWADALAESIEPIKSEEYPEAVWGTETVRKMIADAVAGRNAAHEALRSLACWLGAGGYNAETVDAAAFERKVRDGVDAMIRVETERARGPRISDTEEMSLLRRANAELAAERDGWHRVVEECERIVGAEGTAATPQVCNLPNLIRDLLHSRDALQKFKDWMHLYLDTHGVPHHPPGVHGAEGCRIGDRMDWLMARQQIARARAIEECAKFVENGRFLHDDAPTAKLAREAAAGIRRLPVYAKLPKSVVQDWVSALPLRHQGVLLTAVRGCDTAPKHDPSKMLSRPYRAVVLNAFVGDPKKAQTFIEVVSRKELFERFTAFRKNLDHYPHHYVMHLVHAAEVVGYKHPDPETSSDWLSLYFQLASGLHVTPETEEQLDLRLTADEETFGARDREVITPKQPPGDRRGEEDQVSARRGVQGSLRPRVEGEAGVGDPGVARQGGDGR